MWYCLPLRRSMSKPWDGVKAVLWFACWNKHNPGWKRQACTADGESPMGMWFSFLRGSYGSFESIEYSSSGKRSSDKHIGFTCERIWNEAELVDNADGTKGVHTFCYSENSCKWKFEVWEVITEAEESITAICSQKYSQKPNEVSQQFYDRFEDFKKHCVDIGICWQSICSPCWGRSTTVADGDTWAIVCFELQASVFYNKRRSRFLQTTWHDEVQKLETTCCSYREFLWKRVCLRTSILENER